jgi:hypothetical protein
MNFSPFSLTVALRVELEVVAFEVVLETTLLGGAFSKGEPSTILSFFGAGPVSIELYFFS